MAIPTQNPFCDLPDDIHPILARRNWVGIDSVNETLWQELQPALRLATQMLKNDTTLLWFTHLLFGQPAQSPTHEGTYWSRTAKSWNPAAVNDVKQYLNHEAAGKIKLKFLPRIDETTKTIFGETRERSTYIYKVLKLVEHEDRRLIDTSYHAAFRSYFESGTRSSHQDIFTSFLLGVTIIHELAHAVYALRREPCKHAKPIRSALSGCGRDPFFCDPVEHAYRKPKAELGWALEDYLFGLKFYAEMDPRYGAVRMKHCGSGAYIDDEPTPVPNEQYVNTRPDSVIEFFSKKRWKVLHETKRALNGVRLPPMAALQTVYMGGWRTVWIPNAALINNHADGFFTYTR